MLTNSVFFRVLHRWTGSGLANLSAVPSLLVSSVVDAMVEFIELAWPRGWSHNSHPLAADGRGVDAALLASLPSLDEIFAAPVATRDFVAAGLLPMAQKEFLRCVANVLQHNSTADWGRTVCGTELPQSRLLSYSDYPNCRIYRSGIT